MTEFGIGSVAAGSVSGVAVATFFWMWGGRAGSPGKWLRRYVSSAVMAFTINVSSVMLGIWDWRLLLVIPALTAGSSLGYGGTTTQEKVLRRSFFAFGMLISGFTCVLVFGWKSLPLLALQVLLGIGSVWIGVKSNMHAAAEEVLVAFLLLGPLAFYPFMA